MIEHSYERIRKLRDLQDEGKISLCQECLKDFNKWMVFK